MSEKLPILPHNNEQGPGSLTRRLREARYAAALEVAPDLMQKAKEIAAATPQIDAALESAREYVEEMNKTQKTTLKEAGVMRHALVESGALSDVEVKDMSDEDVQNLVEHMRNEYSPEGTVEPTQSMYEVNPDDSMLDLGSIATIDTRDEFKTKPTDEFLPEVDIVNVGLGSNKAVNAVPAELADKVEPKDPSKFENIVTLLKNVPAYFAERKAAAEQRRGRHRPNSPETKSTGRHRSDSSEASYTRRNDSGSSEAPDKGRHRPGSADSERNYPRWRRGMVGTVAVLAVTATGLFGLASNDKAPRAQEVAAAEVVPDNSLDVPLVRVTDPNDSEGTRVGGGGHEGEAALDDTLAQAVVAAPKYSPDALTATFGEGWINQLKDMGVPSDEIPALLKKLVKTDDQKISEWVYPMNNGDPGVSKTGPIPPDVLQSIIDLQQH